jgi:cytochrome c
VLWAFAAMLLCGMMDSQAAAQGTLAFSPTSVNFGSISAGTSKTVSMTISNASGTVASGGAVTISKVAVSGSAFSVSGLSVPVTINPGVSLRVTLKFAPATSGTFSGYLAILVEGKVGTTYYMMTGTGVATASTSTLTATPLSTSFGSVPIGTTNSQTVQLMNTGTESITISSVDVSGNRFASSGVATPLALDGGKTTNVKLTYAPTVTGDATGTVTIASNATNKSLAMTVSGTGVTATRAIAATPLSLSFGNENVGNSNTLPVELKNTGNSSVTLSGITISGTGITTTGGVSGTTLTPGQSTTVNVTFAPKTAGSISGSVKVASNATNSPATVAMSGTGVSATTHSVALSWSASTSVGITGYYVYRAVGTGGYSRLVTSLVIGLKYTDTAVVSGTEYRYVVTAVDSAGVESGYSSAISATVP